MNKMINTLRTFTVIFHDDDKANKFIYIDTLCTDILKLIDTDPARLWTADEIFDVVPYDTSIRNQRERVLQSLRYLVSQHLLDIKLAMEKIEPQHNLDRLGSLKPTDPAKEYAITDCYVRRCSAVEMQTECLRDMFVELSHYQPETFNNVKRILEQMDEADEEST